MNAKGVLSANVVHAEEVINALAWAHLGQLLYINAEVLPADVPLEVLRVLGLELLQLTSLLLADCSGLCVLSRSNRHVRKVL